MVTASKSQVLRTNICKLQSESKVLKNQTANQINQGSPKKCKDQCLSTHSQIERASSFLLFLLYSTSRSRVQCPHTDESHPLYSACRIKCRSLLETDPRIHSELMFSQTFGYLMAQSSRHMRLSITVDKFQKDTSFSSFRRILLLKKKGSSILHSCFSYSLSDIFMRHLSPVQPHMAPGHHHLTV